jgi:hypothetical protein
VYPESAVVGRAAPSPHILDVVHVETLAQGARTYKNSQRASPTFPL